MGALAPEVFTSDLQTAKRIPVMVSSLAMDGKGGRDWSGLRRLV